MCCINTHFSKTRFVGSLGLYVCNIAVEILEFLQTGVKSHDPLGTRVLGTQV